MDKVSKPMKVSEKLLGAAFSVSALFGFSLVGPGLPGSNLLAPVFAQGAAPTAVQGNQQAVGMYNLGLTAYKQGSLESAVIFFRHATDLDPNLTDAQYNLGVLYQSERRLKEAVPRFQEVLRVKPNDPDAHYQLGIALMDLGRHAEAKAQFQAIAPASQHFADAQKRTQTCDQILAGASVAQPSYSPTATAPAQNMNMNPIAPGDTTAPNPYREAQAYQQQQGGQPQPQQQQVPQPQAQAQTQAPQTQQTPNAFDQAKRKSVIASNPTAVLANSSARVIAAGFNAPAGLAFDRLGNLYVANFASNTVDRISADGTRMQFSGGSNLKGPIGLVCDEGGNVYVANYSGNTVARISPAGVSTIIGTGFKAPYYLTLDRDGNLFVSQQEDNTIVRITLPKTVVTKP
jgi:tetratricopeptide (TPR) repeat protein